MTVHGWPWRHTDKWNSIEEVESAWFQMFRGKNLPEDAIPRARFDVAKFQEMSPDLPFPCSETNCSTFHSNRHGFCHKHRFHRFAMKLCSGLVKAKVRMTSGTAQHCYALTRPTVSSTVLHFMRSNGLRLILRAFGNTHSF